MSETTLNLIQAMANGDALETEQAFGAAMAEKLAVKLDDMRTGIAQNMFNQEVVTEAVAKPSLGKLAADHAEAHQAAEEDGEHDKRPSIEKKITKHYGQETANAVKHHSGMVNDVENKSGPGGPSYKNFHGNFVKKHLGGHDSADHKAYKSQMENMGMQMHHTKLKKTGTSTLNVLLTIF
jgi:hypothetical protein